MAHNRGGFSTLTYVVVVSSVILSIGIALNSRLRSGSETLLIESRHLQASSSSQSCINEAWMRLARNRSYSGGQLNNSGVLCTITIAHPTATTYVITSTGTSGSDSYTTSLSLDDQSGTLLPQHYSN